MHATPSVAHESLRASRPRMQDGVSGGDNEAALLNQAQSGDKDAFTSLISPCLETLYRLVLPITRNHEDAEDTVQEAILKAYANLSQFQRRARFSTWIARIATNEALTILRKQKLMKRAPWEDLVLAEESNGRFPELEQRPDDPEALYARQEVRELMMQAAGCLPPQYHTAFVLTHVKECTNQETARKLDVSVAAVKARVHRARKQVRKQLKGLVGRCAADVGRLPGEITRMERNEAGMSNSDQTCEQY